MAMIQVRGVSDEAHRRLKARAALNGQSLSEYLRLELERIAELPTMEEMLDRVARDAPVELSEPAAETIRRAREERDAELLRRMRDR
jgi:plasmid stability protein